MAGMYQILLADDEQIERMALARRLNRHFGDSCVIHEAVNGAEAVRVFERENIEIVIMDIAMPELNGVEAAEQIRKADQDCVIIFLTAYEEFNYARRALIIRALDYLLKPCEEEDLIAVIEEAMRLTDRRAERAAGAITEYANQEISSELERRGEEAGEARMAQVAGNIKSYIRENYMKEISMQEAARTFQYSDAYFCKLFKQCFDQNFTAYLAKFRINEAKRLLTSSDVNVKDVGRQVGYYDSNYFAKVFKRMTGMIPSEFRENGKNRR